MLMIELKKLSWWYWLATAFLLTAGVFGYCGMARFVSLLPWNRRQPLSMDLVRRTFLSRPIRGSIQEEFMAAG